MLVSWNWLSRYIHVPVSPQKLGERFAMSGLNLESVQTIDNGDFQIDLEVTSNRGDCLGHIGIAREAAVLYDRQLCLPQANPIANGPAIAGSFAVENAFAQACPRYTARIIRGVKVGPSPEWMVELLANVGIKSINNVVDITNFVLLECGQPLHAFDLQKLQGKKVQVRRGQPNETLQAIDHRTYTLHAEDCVIADGDRAIAIAGIMGGADTEVTSGTEDVLIEAAEFTPLAIRRTARRLRLHSPSSFRFERRVDPQGVDWASRRCCELILEIAGGTLDQGSLETSAVSSPRAPVALRLAQIERVLGIQIPAETILKILTGLGCQSPKSTDAQTLTVIPPSWRHDLGREIDLIEEVARIHGYDKIPDDAPIPVVPSRRRPIDYVMDRVRGMLQAAGFCEAMTPSFVTTATDSLYSPWTAAPALETLTPMLEGARTLRRSLIPSLLHSRYSNQAASGLQADLYETAHIYLPSAADESLPVEHMTLGLVTGRDFFSVKGVVQGLIDRLGIVESLSAQPQGGSILDADLALQLQIGEQVIGYMGMLSSEAQKKLKLDLPVTVCELDLHALNSQVNLVPQHRPISPYPVVSRDINLVVEEEVRWAGLEQIVRRSLGSTLNTVRYIETYRNPDKDGAGKKRILFNLQLQKSDATLSGHEADSLVNNVIQQCRSELGAELLK
jgi:phenylalanyl-tRNA synthetase beta chain